ncbi:MAG: hypothetical protein SGILL_009399 [Bacillariaceae sp.]
MMLSILSLFVLYLVGCADMASGFSIRMDVAKTEVWNKVQNFKKDLKWSHWISGTTPIAPKVKVVPSSQEDKSNPKSMLCVPPYGNADELYEAGIPSKVGMNSETLSRPDIRKSREFDHVDVLNENNQWEEELQKICAQVKSKLAPGATAVEAKLHKLVIYREGDHFYRHQDAQQSDREFASLVFFLPSEYEGGEFELESYPYDMHVNREWDGGNFATRWESVEHSPGSNSTSSTWVAFYTDHTHHVCRIKSGHRVTLSYKLYFSGALCPSSALPIFPASLEKIFTSYIETLSRSRKKVGIAIPLLFQYTERTMTPAYLKGVDALLFNALEAIGIKAELKHTLRIDKAWYDHMDEPDWDNPCGLEVGVETYYDEMYLVDERALDQARRMMEDDVLTEDEKSELVNLITARSPRGSELDWFWHDSLPNEYEQLEPISPGSSPFFRGLSSDEYTPWLGNYGVPREFYYLDLAIVISLSKKHIGSVANGD